MDVEHERLLERIDDALKIGRGVLSIAQAAKQIGVHPATLARTISAERKPMWETRRLIEAWCDERLPRGKR